MKLRRQAAAWVVMTAAAMATVAGPAYGEDRLPGFAVRSDTTYGQFRELTAASLHERLDPSVPGTVVTYGGADEWHPLTEAEIRTLAEGGAVRGVERLMAFDRLDDAITFGDIENEVVYKMGRMIKGWVFTVVVEGDKYLVFCKTDGKEVECEVLNPIVV